MARDGANDKPPSPAVSVVVVTYESGPTLADCLAALRAQSFEDFEIVMVDNASADGAAQAAVAADPAIRLIANPANLGFAAAVNQGAAAARGRWLALLNPDAFAEPDWLAQLMEDPSRLDGLGDAMSAVGFPYRGGYRAKDPGRLDRGESFSACGGAMLIDRALFLSLGGFDERLFCYCEDVDLGYRLRLAGEPTLIAPTAVVRHVGSASSGGPRSDFAVFHGSRNRLWVFVKNTPPLLFWLTLPLHLAATAVLFARHATRGELAAPWRGFKAAVAGLGGVWAARREAQARRKASSWAIARAMTWNPLDLLLRRVVLKPAGSTRR
jgi:N-acetylglucosaminyl-diphospho-decaprenol L-rhamnosyltransferase